MRRLLPLVLLFGCGQQTRGLGSSAGTVTYADPETGDPVDVRFDGGAVAWERDEGVRWIAVTDWGLNFDCEYAQVHLAGLAGRDIDRRRRHHELVWSEAFPETVSLSFTREGLLGNSASVASPILTAEVQFDDDAKLVGTLTTPNGSVSFDAYDCGVF